MKMEVSDVGELFYIDVKEVIKVHLTPVSGLLDYKRITFTNPVKRTSSLQCAMMDASNNRGDL